MLTEEWMNEQEERGRGDSKQKRNRKERRRGEERRGEERRGEEKVREG